MRARAIRRCAGASRFRGPDRCRGQGDELLPARQNRRAARRLSRDLAKALKMNAMLLRGESESQPPAGDASARRSFRMRNATPMVSFTFDDLPKSAATTGAASLEAHGARGTFYVSGGLVGVETPEWPAGDADDVLSLYRRGHEIGCHTFSHQRASDLDVASLANEIMRNRGTSARWTPRSKTETFAYPVTATDRLAGSSQLKDPVPDLPQHRAWHQQRRQSICNSFGAVPLIDGQMDRDGIDRAFDEAETNNGWLIFYGHDVAERPSPWGCSPAPAQPRPRGGGAPENPGYDHGGGIAMRPRINALFAISVNSPSMSMVNFPCCVCCARRSPGARGVTRRVTPQPMCAAVGMEAGVDAYL